MTLTHRSLLTIVFFASAPLALANDAVTDEIITYGRYLYVDEVNALKSPTPVIDVPQSLSIITNEQIKLQGANAVGDLIAYVPGVNMSQGEGHRDAVVFRGVRSTADFYIDGVRDDVQYYRSLYNLEQVEILRGPNALLFGRGGTGGILNRVTKKAVIDDKFIGYQASINTFGAFNLQSDLNYALTDNSALRVNAMYESLNNHRDFYDGDRFALNPTARIQVSPQTRIDLSYEYINNKRFVDRGIVSVGPNGTTIGNGIGGRTPVEALDNITFGDEASDTAEFVAHIARADVQHRFNEHLKGTFSASIGNYDKLYSNLFPVGYVASNPAFGGISTVDLDGYIDTTQRRNIVLAGNLISEFQTGRFGHTVVFGGEYISSKNDNDRFNSFFDTSQDDVETFAVERRINIRNGVGVNAAGQATRNTFSDLNDRTSAQLDVVSAYVQDEIEVSAYLDLIVGLRYDNFDFRVDDLANNLVVTRSRKDEEISPRLGLILKPRENISVYGSYSESFIPQSGEQFAEINQAEQALDPDVFENLEIGLKWDFHPNLSFTAALFELSQIAGQPDGTADNGIDRTETRVEGLELQLQGNLTDDWFLTAGYSYLEGEQNVSDTRNIFEPRELPQHMVSIWSNYQLSDKFGLGAGMTYQDDSLADIGNTTVLPSFTRIDAAAYYDYSDKLRLQLNIENLTNEQYFPSAHTDDQITVGAPLNARFTISGLL